MTVFRAGRQTDPDCRGGWLAALAGLSLALAGCNASDHSGATAVHGASKAPKHSRRVAAGPGQEALGDMVAAVSASQPGPPVEMRFFLPTRPEVGQVMELHVAVVPRAPVPDSLSVTFQVADGLEIVEGAQLESVDKLTDGEPIRHVLKVLPKRDGIFALTAVVAYSSSNLDSSRTFSIPVIAGEGMPEQVAKGP